MSEEVEDSTYDLKVFGLVQRDSFIGYRLRGLKNRRVSIRIPLHIWRDVFPVVRLGRFRPCPPEGLNGESLDIKPIRERLSSPKVVILLGRTFREDPIDQFGCN